MIKIHRGLDLPITGQPKPVVELAPQVRQVAIVGDDYHGMKPTMAIKEGDRVSCGQIIFSDKKTEGVHYTAPASGTVSAINRGARRVLQSVVIDVDGDDAIDFGKHDGQQLSNIDRETLVDTLVNSGLWTAFRTRPYSKVPEPKSAPSSIFVTAMDTNPLAVDPIIVIKEHEQAFKEGISALTQLTDGKVFVCHAAGASVDVPSLPQVSTEPFSGAHPAGNAGTHIHFLDPVSANKTVWTINYQDVIAIAKLLTTGQLWTERVVSLGGPNVKNPRLLRTRLGANLNELVQGELNSEHSRVVSGSVFGGRTASDSLAFLGRYHHQISVLEEGDDRPFLHYLRPGVNYFSKINIYVSKFFKNKKFNFTTSTNGSERAMVPIGIYEEIMPLDILPTQLLRALIVGDTDMAQKLGCLEVDEEDLALCTFVCPGKYEYGPILRENLARIEKEG